MTVRAQSRKGVILATYLKPWVRKYFWRDPKNQFYILATL